MLNLDKVLKKFWLMAFHRSNWVVLEFVKLEVKFIFYCHSLICMHKTVLLRDRKRRTARAPHLQKFPKCLSNFSSKMLSIFCPKLCPFFVPNFVQHFCPNLLGGTPRGAPPPVGGYPRRQPPSWGGRYPRGRLPLEQTN